MVGHTGDLEATARACQLVDKCLKELLQTVEEQGGRWLVTADHGNADDMVQRGKKDQKPILVEGKLAPLTSHTLVSSSCPICQPLVSAAVKHIWLQPLWCCHRSTGCSPLCAVHRKARLLVWICFALCVGPCSCRHWGSWAS